MTQEKVSPVSFDYEMEDEDGNSVYHHTVSRWSYAIPLEIIFQTPLTRWNPYGVAETESADFDYSRSGGCSTDDAFDGWTYDNAYFTPQGFFESETEHICALDSDGVPQPVMASGHRITFPEIGNGVSHVRQRYPIFPVSADGTPAWKEIKALEDVFLGDDYDGEDIFGADKDLTYGFTVYLEGGGHQHELYIEGWKVSSIWYDEDSGAYHNDTSRLVEVDAETRDGHSHTVEIGRWRATNESDWQYIINRCRYGSLSDTEQFTDDDYMDGECVDLHNSIVRR